MKRARPVLEQRPPGGYRCRCGQQQGAHNFGLPGMPSKDGACAGFVLGEHRIPDDPHAGHSKMPFRDLHRECPPCFKRKMEWAAQQPRASHVYRAYLRLRRDYGNE